MERGKADRDARPSDITRAPSGTRHPAPVSPGDRPLPTPLSENDILNRLASAGFAVERSAFIDRARASMSEVELAEVYLAGTDGRVTDEPELLTWAVHELWGRWLPDLPSIETTVSQVDRLIDGLFASGVDEEIAHRIATLHEVVDALSAASRAWDRPAAELYVRLSEAALYDWDATAAEVLDELPEPQCVEEKCRLAERWHQVAGSAEWAETLARSLIVAGRTDEGESLYRQVCADAEQPFWLHIVAGDAYVDLYSRQLDRRWLLRAVNHLARAVEVEEQPAGSSGEVIRETDRSLVRARLTDIQRKLSDHQVLDDHHSEAAALRSLADELRDRYTEPDD